jgi:hypothetical protein
MRNVTATDQSVRYLCSSDLPWTDIFVHLKLSYPKFARQLFGSAVDRKHLVIFNPKNPDYLIYLKIDLSIDDPKNSERFQIFAVSREGIRDPVEYDQINDTINTILHYLWNLKQD